MSGRTTSMTHGQSLLRAILEDPDSDAARLVYADWLEETGEGTRAEFIRVQVELATCDDREPHCDRYVDRQYCNCAECFRYRSNADRAYRLRHRELELTEMPLAQWTKCCSPLVGGPGLPTWTWTCRRGFVASVQLTTADFLLHAKDLFAAQPITEVRLTDREPDFVERESGFDNWTWHNDESRPNHHTITRNIWLLIERGWFPTENDARAALSRACVAYGREQAGLPLLSEETRR